MSQNGNRPGLSYNQGMNPQQQKSAAAFFRPNDRAPQAMRPVRLTPHYTSMAEGSVLIEVGHTRVLCNATVETGVPGWLKNSGRGWVTAEYGMLPRATLTRTPREAAKGRQGGRTHEIQRLIGRALRAAVDLSQLGERTITLDCDVIQADGGTRTAAITGAAVALAIALNALVKAGTLKQSPMKQLVAATSVGIVSGTPLLDLTLFRHRSFSAGLGAQLVFWCGQASFFLVLARISSSSRWSFRCSRNLTRLFFSPRRSCGANSDC